MRAGGWPAGGEGRRRRAAGRRRRRPVRGLAEVAGAGRGARGVGRAAGPAADGQGPPAEVLDVRRAEGTFADRDRWLLRALASQLSIGLENARLYRQLDGLFRQYMSPDMATALLADPTQAALGEEVAEVTVRNADLRGFTPFSGRTTPDRVVAMLNQYFGRAVPVLLANGARSSSSSATPSWSCSTPRPASPTTPCGRAGRPWACRRPSRRSPSAADLAPVPDRDQHRARPDRQHRQRRVPQLHRHRRHRQPGRPPRAGGRRGRPGRPRPHHPGSDPAPGHRPRPHRGQGQARPRRLLGPRRPQGRPHHLGRPFPPRPRRRGASGSLRTLPRKPTPPLDLDERSCFYHSHEQGDGDQANRARRGGPGGRAGSG